VVRFGSVTLELTTLECVQQAPRSFWVSLTKFAIRSPSGIAVTSNLVCFVTIRIFMPGGLHARLCHAFLVYISMHSQYIYVRLYAAIVHSDKKINHCVLLD